MRKYTDSPVECHKCNKRNYFLVTVLKKGSKAFFLTKCPRCNSYDEVLQLTNAEFESFRTQTEKEG